MKNTKKLVLGCILGAIIVFFILKNVDIRHSLGLLKSVSSRLIFICCTVYLIGHIFRALRFSVALGVENISLKELIAVVSIHSFLLLILPMKTGEGGFLMLVKKIGNVSLRKGFASLLLVRCYDLVAFSFMILLFFMKVLSDGYRSKTVTFAALAAVTSLLFLFARYMKPVVMFGLRLLEKIAGFFNQPSSGQLDIKGKISAFVEEFNEVSASSKHYKLLVISLVVWCANFGIFYLFINSIDRGIDYIHAALGGISLVLVSMLPINVPGSVGTLEAGWMLGYVILGVDKEAALASGMLMHAFLISFGLVLSAVGVTLLNMPRTFRSKT